MMTRRPVQPAELDVDGERARTEKLWGVRSQVGGTKANGGDQKPAKHGYGVLSHSIGRARTSIASQGP